MTIDKIHVSVFDSTGINTGTSLTKARGQMFQEVLNQDGFGSFEVPLDESTTSLLTPFSIVKFAWIHNDAVVKSFASRITSEISDLAVERSLGGRRWVRFDSQRGALSMLRDAIVFPEYGYDGFGIEKRVAAPDRHAGFMSASGGAWYVSADWTAPNELAWGSGSRGKKPADFHAFDSTAKWISAYDPDTSQTSLKVNYFRGAFFAATAMDVIIMFAGDDFADVWVDGQPVATADRTVHNQWTNATSVTVRVSDGEHVVAVRAQNSPYVPGHSDPIAFICSIRQADSKGDPTGGPLLNTNATDWLVNDDTTEPGYNRASLFLRLFAEAATRNVFGIANLQHGWTDAADSDGNAWADHGQLSLSVGANLYDVLAQFCELGMDAWVDPSTLTLKLYRRRGSDLSGSVSVTLPAGYTGNLKDWQITTTRTRYNATLGQLSQGQWTSLDDAASVTALGGRIEAAASLGSADSIGSAHAIMQALLDQNSVDIHELGSAEVGMRAPIAGIAFDVGDTIGGPGPRNVGSLKGRCTAITYDGTGDKVLTKPEFKLDLSA